jgi:hypothetical protein
MCLVKVIVVVNNFVKSVIRIPVCNSVKKIKNRINFFSTPCKERITSVVEWYSHGFRNHAFVTFYDSSQHTDAAATGAMK